MEIDVGIVCSCLMLLPAFLKHHLPQSWCESLSESVSRLADSLSSMTGKKSSQRSTNGNSWPKDSYREMDKSHGLIVKTHSTGPPTEASLEMQDPPEWAQAWNPQSAHVRALVGHREPLC
jgi:hypothetical protein